jgi:hypothetical protein
VLAFLFLVIPFVSFQPLSGSDSSSFGIFNGYHLKSGFVILITLGCLIGFNISFRFKNSVHILLGFRENEALLNFTALWMIMLSLIGIEETIRLSSVATSTLSVTSGFVFLEFMVLGGLVFSFFQIIQKARLLQKGSMVSRMNYDVSSQENITHPVIKGLFEDEQKEPSSFKHHREE